jgi:hypothetical protein
VFPIVRLDGPAASRHGRCVNVASLLRRKAADAAVGEVTDGREPGLRRTLGAVDLVLMGVGAIVGAGIFSSVGDIAAGGANHRARGRPWCCRSC